MRIIPAIDLKDGKCVRLFKGDFDRQTEYSRNPLEIAQRFSELSVADLHIVDLDGARSGSPDNRDIVKSIAQAVEFDVQVGGGIRDGASIEGWLSLGVARCVIGSLAVTHPDRVAEWIQGFGPERIVLALDVSLDPGGSPLLSTHGWVEKSDTTLWQCIDSYLPAGLVHVLCTDINRDGAMSGPNVTLYRELRSRYPDLQLQASGGVRHIGDLRTLRAEGLPAAITGRALLDGAITADEVTAFLHDE